MEALMKQFDQALEAELQAVLAYRDYLNHSSEPWTVEQARRLGELHAVKCEAREKADHLLGQLPKPTR